MNSMGHVWALQFEMRHSLIVLLYRLCFASQQAVLLTLMHAVVQEACQLVKNCRHWT